LPRGFGKPTGSKDKAIQRRGLFLFLLVGLVLPTSAETERRTVTVEYYGLPGCHDCQEFLAGTWEDLRRESALNGIDLVLTEHDVLDPEAFASLKKQLDERGVAFTGVPVLISQQKVLQGNDLEPTSLASLLELSAQSEALPNTKTAPDLSWGLVGLAGLVDGVNPCVLTTLLFLLSVWGLDRRGGLVIGIAYTLGVFVTYTLVGVGLLKAATLAQSVPWAGPLLDIVTLVGLVALTGFSLFDAWQAHRGRTKEMALKLPGFLDRTLRTVVRRQRSLAIGLPAAFGLGALISLLEFVCTGQVYLPTLVYMNQTQGDNALPLLLWYNLAFIAPLLAVFLAIHLGTGHRSLVLWAQKHLATTKLLLALVFGLLAVLFTWNMVFS